MTTTMLTLVVIVLALVFDFLNGIHDSSNVVATMISSRALPPRVALWMTAVANFLGPFIFGVAVAETIGGIVDANAISLQVLIAALGQCDPVEPAHLVPGIPEQFFARAGRRHGRCGAYRGRLAGDQHG